MTQKRRKRTDSVAGQTEIMQDAAKPCLEPPSTHPISKAIRPYWETVVNGKARRLWNDQELIVAVELATNLYMIEKVRREMLKPSFEEVVDEMGKMRPNPLSKVLSDRVIRANRAMILLKIHAEATQGKSRETVKTNQANAAAKENAAETGGAVSSDKPESLIPGLSTH